MQILKLVTTRTENGVVQVLVGDGEQTYCIVLSAEGARNLADSLEDEAGVADLENEEWKAERLQAAAEATP